MQISSFPSKATSIPLSLFAQQRKLHGKVTKLHVQSQPRPTAKTQAVGPLILQVEHTPLLHRLLPLAWLSWLKLNKNEGEKRLLLVQVFGMELYQGNESFDSQYFQQRGLVDDAANANGNAASSVHIVCKLLYPSRVRAQDVAVCQVFHRHQQSVFRKDDLALDLLKKGWARTRFDSHSNSNGRSVDLSNEKRRRLNTLLDRYTKAEALSRRREIGMWQFINKEEEEVQLNSNQNSNGLWNRLTSLFRSR